MKRQPALHIVIGHFSTVVLFPLLFLLVVNALLQHKPAFVSASLIAQSTPKVLLIV